MTFVSTIAVAQTVPVPGQIGANLAQHLHLALLAADQQAQILVFPELSLTGYEIGLAPDLVIEPDEPRLAPLRELSVSRGMTIIAGAPIRLASRLHIGALIIAPDHTVAVYTKHRLGAFSAQAARDGAVPPPESTAFAPGDRNPLIAFGDDTAAIAVCADIGDPAHPFRAAQRGATIYLASMFVIPSDYEGETRALAAYASRYHMIVAFANFGGPSGGLASAGRSAIWSARG